MKNFYLQAASFCQKSFVIFLLIYSLTATAQESMRANLYVVSGSSVTLVDGSLTNYNNIYSNRVDVNDAWKMTNPGINLSVFREATDLVVERRSVYTDSDTTFFRMWNLPQYHYRLKLMLKNLNHPGMRGFMKDKYLQTEIPVGLNDTTYIDFYVNSDPASGAQDRFELIYGLSAIVTVPVDVNITSINASRKGKDILVEWKVVNEESIETYTVEHSTDGRNFSGSRNIEALNTPVAKSYQYTDVNAGDITHYYRVRATSKGGKIQQSPIARVNPSNSTAGLNVYPNPVLNKTVQLQFTNQPAGKYQFTLLYNNGARQTLGTLEISENSANRSIALPAMLPAGIYRLQVNGPNNTLWINSLQVL